MIFALHLVCTACDSVPLVAGGLSAAAALPSAEGAIWKRTKVPPEAPLVSLPGFTQTTCLQLLAGCPAAD